MGYRDLSASYDLGTSRDMGPSGFTGAVIIVVTDVPRAWPNVQSKRTRKSYNIIRRSKESNLHTLSSMSEDGTRTVSIMANKKGPGPPTRYEDGQMHRDSGVDCCVVSKSTADRLLGGCAPESLAHDRIVSTSSGQTYTCSHKFDARWCWKSKPSSRAVTLFIAPGLEKEAVFSEDQGAETSSSGGPIAPVECRPPKPGMFVHVDEEQDKKRAVEANKIKEDVIMKQQNQKKDFYASPKKKLCEADEGSKLRTMAGVAQRN
ncbi:uncharacterized protein Z518_00405 [Rhinocladiella mackenziei CBS 650.93]|uniref:Rhinocladiella mackenziei CBS 650.93 unplaced genomic scaffold supercont1.1, whole genome shotgun sequence n=1 Tax=Rhinocladiella mackenziei CBS 650.93 TaxID=1442369 RepID=A0A0D2J0V2_9EURO|nr:uncharacterized protein Z518_00405 [Rhinocladiella mackenziei CBS 650.93]KIX09326.1 hypothetical protein Z518_00405 [Rhinocladiella mackenziei CBS 650.93]